MSDWRIELADSQPGEETLWVLKRDGVRVVWLNGLELDTLLTEIRLLGKKSAISQETAD